MHHEHSDPAASKNRAFLNCELLGLEPRWAGGFDSTHEADYYNSGGPPQTEHAESFSEFFTMPGGYTIQDTTLVPRYTKI